MRKFLLVMTALFLYSGVFSQYVTLYEDCSFRGRSKTLRPGRYNLDQVGFGVNRLSSFRVPRGLRLVLYDGYDPGTGNKTRFMGDVSCLGYDWNDRTQSVLVEVDNSAGGGNQGGGYYPDYPSYGGGAGPQVILYQNCSFMGYNVALAPGSYDTRSMGITNDNLSSIRIPNGYSVTVYRDGGFRGESRTYYSNVYCLDNRWNDQVSSIVIRGPGGTTNPPVTGSGGRVVVFDQCYFAGSSGQLAPGRYRSENLVVGNDRISSLRVPNGFRVTVYQNNDFRGASRTFTGDQYCLDGQWNNQVSSIIVEGPGGNSGEVYPPVTPPGFSGVAVYKDSWYRGEHTIFYSGYHDLRYGNLQGNISSLAIQPGFRVTVYDDFNFRGRSATFTGSVPNLNAVGWNDRIRSMLVTRN